MRTDWFSQKLVRMVVLALMAALFFTGQVLAAEFKPSKPITMVAPAAPGGGSDVLSRTIAQIVANEKLSPQPMVVQNIPGGGQAIALTQVAQQKGNTHMLVVANPASVAGLLVAGKGAPSIRDLTMIAQLALDEQLIVVKSDSRFKSIQDIIAESKKKENSLSIAGSDQADRVCSRLFEKAAGIKMRYAPFNSGGENMAALLGGHVDMMWANPPEFVAQYEAKAVRPIILAQENRISRFKDVPTFKENGIDLVFKFFRGVIAPPGLSPEAVAYYEAMMKKLIETKAWKENYLAKNMLSPAWQTSKEFTKTINGSEVVFAETLKELGLIK
ncbi:MAG: tripartite tricarboxylate transporter substrate-binding protein [Deltaproteobacteria bacterium]|nr:tripartite tricarboxylate transporter substrate-binding protein [Deltaproteobacteria bacterium]